MLVSVTRSSLLIFILAACCKGKYVFINSSKSLDKWLEYHPQNIASVHLELDSSVKYRLRQHIFSYLSNVNLTLTSDRSDQVAHIYCGSTSSSENGSNNLLYQPTRGIAFVNSTVTLKRLSFHNCGMYLPKEITSMINHYFNYSSFHAAGLVLVESRLLSSHVTFESSFGFAVIGHNLINSSFEYNNVHHSMKLNKSDNWISFGSGIIVYFSKVNTSAGQASSHVKFSHTNFENNFDVHLHANCIDQRYFQPTSHWHIPIPNAAGLTVIYTRQDAHVAVDNGIFSHNIGSGGYGAMLVLNFQNSSTSTTVVTNSLYVKNAKFAIKARAYNCRGDSLQFFWYWDSNKNHLTSPIMLKLRNTTFNDHIGGKWNNIAYSTHGAVYIGVFAQNVSTTFRIDKFTCKNNSVVIGDHCLSATLRTQYRLSSSVRVIITDAIALNNHHNNPKELFNFKSIKKAVFAKSSTFKNNIGSVIHAIDSTVYLHGKMTFTNNTGLNGGGLNIEGHRSYLYLMKGLEAEFISNRAYLAGGAIYINTNSYYSKCGLQTVGNSKVSFHGNFANSAGNSLFVSPMYNCFNNGTYHSYWKSFYYQWFNLSTDEVNTPLQLSTSPDHFNIRVPEYPVLVFPGEIFELHCYIRDSKERSVFSLVNTEVYKFGVNKSIHIWLTQFGGNQVRENTDGTLFNLSVHTDSEAQRKATLSLSVPNLYKKVVDIVLKPCPVGFTLDTVSGSCQCSAVFDKLQGTNCFIDNKTIKKPAIDNIWVGSVADGGTDLALSKTCPFTYCTCDPSYNYIKSTDGGLVLINSANQVKPYCLHNRTGVLCGKCESKYNYSVVFGTSECSKCSNMWLFTIPMYMAVGVVLIGLIFTFNLTLTSGGINALIFYAQVADVGLLEWLSLPLYNELHVSSGTLRQFGFILLSFFNLNLGFPLCFYNGMDQLWKTGLSLVFPIYLLTIVCTIIVLSRYSTWLSNKTSHCSIQVLVTVVHLSFSKLLLTFIDVFMPATLYTSNGTMKVWYWDGSHEYMKKSHLLLSVVTATTVFVFVIPYIAVLLLGKLLIRYTKKGKLYLRPVLEALHAPYKKNQEYWFAARLLLLIIIYMLYVFFRESGSLILYRGIASLLALFLIAHALFQPFKSKALALLEYWLMLNIAMVYVTLKNATLPNAFTLVAVLLALLTFAVTLVYQILKTLFKSFCSQKNINEMKNKLNFQQRTLKCNRNSLVHHLQNTDSYYESCNEYREPLIKDSD